LRLVDAARGAFTEGIYGLVEAVWKCRTAICHKKQSFVTLHSGTPYSFEALNKKKTHVQLLLQGGTYELQAFLQARDTVVPVCLWLLLWILVVCYWQLSPEGHV